MADDLNRDAANLCEVLSDTTEFADPVFAQASDALARFMEASGDLANKAKPAAKTGQALVDLLDEAFDTATEEKNSRARDVKKAWLATSNFVDAAIKIQAQEIPTNFEACGDTVQDVLDKLEFKDKKQIAELRKKAIAFYPTESALLKEAQAWSVRANQVAELAKKCVSKLDNNNQIQAVHANGLAKFAQKAKEASKALKG
jgi:hypothetical protein